MSRIPRWARLLILAGGLGLIWLAAYVLNRPAVSPDSDLPTAATAAPTATDSVTNDCQPQPLAFASSPALRRKLAVHRYVGTVAGKPATAVLQWYTPDSISGQFYLHQGGPEYELSYTKTHAGPVVMSVSQVYGASDDSTQQGQWQLAAQPAAQPGTVLKGIWLNAGQQHAVELREDYSGAIRYGLETLLLAGGPPETGDEEADVHSCLVPTSRRDFLTLLQPAQVRSELRPLLTRSSEARRQRMLAEHEPDAQVIEWVDVRLNGFGLLSYQTITLAEPFGGRPQWNTESSLFDLTTGEALTVASQLQPGYEPALRRLLTQHLLHDPAFDFVNQGDEAGWEWTDEQGNATDLVSLPNLTEFSADDLTLTAVGLEATYSPFSLYETPGGMEPYTTVVIPYAELRPLVMPGSALARMLAARGIK